MNYVRLSDWLFYICISNVAQSIRCQWLCEYTLPFSQRIPNDDPPVGACKKDNVSLFTDFTMIGLSEKKEGINIIENCFLFLGTVHVMHNYLCICPYKQLSFFNGVELLLSSGNLIITKVWIEHNINILTKHWG